MRLHLRVKTGFGMPTLRACIRERNMTATNVALGEGRQEEEPGCAGCGGERGRNKSEEKNRKVQTFLQRRQLMRRTPGLHSPSVRLEDNACMCILQL